MTLNPLDDKADRAEKQAIFLREHSKTVAAYVPGQAGINPGPAQPRAVEQPKSTRRG